MKMSSHLAQIRVFRFFVVLTCLLLTSGQVLAARTQPAIPTGIDLDVTYISREPRYNWDAPKQWPAAGETVTFTAHVINKGTMPSGSFKYEWLIDNQVVSSGTSSGIASQTEKTFTLPWSWITGRHIISFRADTQNQVAETAENNNALSDFTDALTVGFWVEQSVYNDFNGKQNGIGTYSWEDWAQRQISTYNELFEQSKLPLASQGVLTRLRLDKITIVPDHTLFHLNSQHAPIETATDVQWGFSVEEYLNCPWPGCYDISWNVHHELGHYLFGRVDLYALDVQGGDVDVRDSSGNMIAGTPLLPYIAWDVVHYNSRTGADLMTTLDYANPMFLSDHTVYSLNQDWPAGERTHGGWTYIHDIPTQSKLKVLDNDNQPIPNVQVAVYQAVDGDGSSGPYSQYLDNTPDISGITNSEGLLSLGSKPFGDIQNYWGFTAGDILVKLTHPTSGKIRYVLVEAIEFNLAYWRGETSSYTHTIYFPEGPQRLRSSDNQLTFSASQGSDPVPQKIDVWMLGEGVDKRWSVSKSTVSWLRTIPYSNHSGIGFQPGPLSFIIESAGLPTGTYTTEVAISAMSGAVDSPQTVSVTLNVGGPPSFSDVPATHWAWDYIERLYKANITGGCSANPLSYCPENSVTRAQMAIFLEKGLYYPGAFSPPNVAPTFTDTVAHWAEDWIEALRSDGITGGCGPNLYCPENPVTRAQMAVFLLKAKYGSSYTPPTVGATTGFTDVPTTHWAAPWIKQLAAEGITGGCGAGIYCPESPVTRAQMAVFLVRTFNLP